MFDAIDNCARRTATKLSNWVLNLPFWPEGAVGERRLRYVLLGLLAADQVMIFLSNWSLPGITVIMAIFGVAAIAVYADILRAIYKNQPWRMATYIETRLIWLFIGIIHMSWLLVFVVQGYFEFHGSMLTWWLMYELEDVKPPRKKKPRKESAWQPSAQNWTQLPMRCGNPTGVSVLRLYTVQVNKARWSFTLFSHL